MDKPHSKFDHVYAIVRIDEMDLSTNPEDAVTVQKVVLDKTTAEREVERLNRLNASKGCVYFYQVTRLERAFDLSALALTTEVVGGAGE